MELPQEFHGPVALFPLPNVVFFPGAWLPLHIFEPRYRTMVADALAGDRLVAMALLAPGWEADYEGRPEVYPVATVGRIVRHQPLPDGRSNILLVGLERVLVQRELPADPYRRAEVSVLPDRLTPETLPQASRLAHQIHDLYLELFFWAHELVGPTPPTPGEAMSPGRYFDRVATSLRVDPRLRQAVLAEVDVLERGQRLHSILTQLSEAARRKPEPPARPPPEGDPRQN